MTTLDTQTDPEGPPSSGGEDGWPPTEQQLDEMYNEQGMTLREIGNKYGKSPEAIRLKMEAADLERRNSEGSFSSKRPDEWSDKRLYELHHIEDESVEDLADAACVHERTIRRWLEKAGIEVRPKSDFTTEQPREVPPCADCGTKGGRGEKSPFRLDASKWGGPDPDEPHPGDKDGRVCHSCYMRHYHQFQKGLNNG